MFYDIDQDKIVQKYKRTRASKGVCKMLRKMLKSCF